MPANRYAKQCGNKLRRLEASLQSPFKLYLTSELCEDKNDAPLQLLHPRLNADFHEPNTFPYSSISRAGHLHHAPLCTCIRLLKSPLKS